MLRSLPLFSLIVWSAPLMAQAGPEGAGATALVDQGVADIVVTAQRREERLLDVPVTISALSGERMQAIGLSQFDQVSTFVPGVFVQEQSPNNPGFVIRGITSDSGSAQAAQRVSVYYLGVDVSRSRGSYFDLFDIERVEVVKGPQSTLFGTAAAIGAWSVIPAGVRPGETSGELRGGIGNLDQRRLSGHLNLAHETVGLRFAFSHKTRRGVVENIAGSERTPNPAPRQDDLNGQDQFGARASIMLQPDPSLRLDLVVSYDGQRAPGTAFKSGTLRPFGGDLSPFTFAELGGSPESLAVLGAEKLGLTRDVWDVNLTARFEPAASRWSYTGITAYREFISLEVFDADGSAAWFLEFAEDAQGHQLSHESRMNFEGERLRGFAGASIFREQGFQNVPFSSEEGTFLQCVQRVVPGLPCVDAQGRVTAAAASALLTGGLLRQVPYRARFENQGTIEALSVFADVTLTPIAAIDVSLGARYTWEDRASGYIAVVPPSRLLAGLGLRAGLLPFADTAGQTFRASRSNEAFLPRANLLWRIMPGLNAYATAGKGRRSPVVQLASRATPAGPAPALTLVPAETIWNYEGGVKYADRRFGGSVGVFWQDYTNFQVSVIEGGQAVTRNAGTATNRGVEAEASLRLQPAVLLFGNVAYIDAGIDDRPENGIFRGNRFRLQSEWQASGGVDLRVPLGSAQLFAVPSVTHQSSMFFELPNNPRIAEGPVTLVNLRAGIQSADRRFELSGFATNLLDREWVIDAGNTGGAFGIPTFIRGLPRLFGVELAVRF